MVFSANSPWHEPSHKFSGGVSFRLLLQPLRGDEIATSRGITMPHFAKVLNIRRSEAPQMLLSQRRSKSQLQLLDSLILIQRPSYKIPLDLFASVLQQVLLLLFVLNAFGNNEVSHLMGYGYYVCGNCIV